MSSENFVKTSEVASRTAALQQVAFLDSPAEEGFDRLTRLARTALNVPVAAISVPLEKCLLLKSISGFREALASSRILPAPEKVFCDEVIRTGREVIIADARETPSLLPDALQEHGFLSYAGIPLVSPDGVVLASFCVLDKKTRVWTEEEIAVLRDLTAAAATEIELRYSVARSQKTQRMLAGQKRVLEMITKGAPLRDTLTVVAELIDQQAEGIYSSILLLEGETLMRGAAPGLPESFNCNVHQLPIYPAIGPCGLAAHQCVQVISPDLAADDRWSDTFRQLATAHGLRSSWSTPIPGSDGKVLGTFAMYYTEPRDPGPFEQELVGVATHLAGIAIERARSEEALRQRAEELALADRRKDEFLAVLAHELRNPLAAARTALQVQQLQAGRNPTRMEEILERQVQHLARLADDLLDVSRIVSGKIELRAEHLDLKQLVEGVAEDYRPEMENHGLSLELDLGDQALPMLGDRTRLVQVIGNILHNSVKFTNAGGRVAIHIRAQQEERQACIIIEDTGIGMSLELLEQVFQPFTQHQQALDRSKGGLGLGLSLVANLVKMHGGEVMAESPGIGRGSRFTITLPLLAPPKAAVPSGSSWEASGSGGLKVLVIEDNRDTALSLQELLSVLGYEVRVSFDGRSGVQEALAFRPQAVICDIGLPEMDGYAVANALRRNPATSHAHLIAYTGYGQPEDRQRSREHCFDLHLTKASAPTELLNALAAFAHEQSIA